MKLVEQIELACLIEATARKPGNVHPLAKFDDLCYADFERAATAIAEPLAAVGTVGLGNAIFDAVRATKTATGTNVNLGIILLLAPLAAVPTEIPLEKGISAVLSNSTIEDAERVYAAILLAQPGGLGQATSQDVRDRPTITLREAMTLAADRDRIGQQYANNYELVFQARRKLSDLVSSLKDWESAVVTLHLWILSQWPDTLIARKCGWDMANHVSSKAGQLLRHIPLEKPIDFHDLTEFDNWLRADGHRRNPGATADLIAAALFTAIRDGFIQVPTLEDVKTTAASLARHASKTVTVQEPLKGTAP